ncbi:hypothetical protein AB1Y20_017994 [Prymnesium parvum]|uniref:Nucleotide-diphospho-sugar transferase domain-containing protein n=1 Tax=Prymnesium parvum TaxID=97485 RepID=A0AB34JP29_PRYPA
MVTCRVALALACLGCLTAVLLRLRHPPSPKPVAIYPAARPLAPLLQPDLPHPLQAEATSAPSIPHLQQTRAPTQGSSSLGHSTAGRSVVLAAARTNGPFYGDIHLDGELERAVRLISRRGEIVLLHGDAGRLRMLVNLVANLNDLSIYHILLLGFSESQSLLLPSRTLRSEALSSTRRIRSSIGCAHSTYLRSGELGAARKRWRLNRKYVAWIQKFHYLRRLVELNVAVLALDSDVITMVDPYPYLHGAFGKYRFITAFDTKGGFANVNVGIIYVRNSSTGGPVHHLFVEFEARVDAALKLPPPKNVGRREQQAVRFFWDQNLFNKVLFSALAGRQVYLPDDSDAPWTRQHEGFLRSLSTTAWLQPDVRIATPSGFAVREPWYPSTSDYRWHELKPPPASDLPPERVLLAPPWLISADNVFGHRYKHWLYGARPPPCVFLHFVCVASGEHSRILPMTLFGKWHESAVRAEVESLSEARFRSHQKLLNRSTDLAGDGRSLHEHERRQSLHGIDGHKKLADNSSNGRLLQQLARGHVLNSAPASRRILALADGTLRHPLRPRPWSELNALQAVLGSLAVLADRIPGIPALDCSDVRDSFLQPGNLPNRCFWHVHSEYGVRCVFRVGVCADEHYASPIEVERAMKSHQRSSIQPPTISINMQRLDKVAELRAAKHAVEQLLQRYTNSTLVLLDLLPPPDSEPPAALLKALPDRQQKETQARWSVSVARTAVRQLNAGLPLAMDSFGERCPELVDRTKLGNGRTRRECTNVC